MTGMKRRELSDSEYAARARMILPMADEAALGDIGVSFEFFPPKTESMEKSLWEAVDCLAPLAPRFVSVTYGAGGSTRERTHDIVTRIQQKTGIRAAAHLTCVGATRDQIDAIARRYWEAGIRHVVALRGDPPEGASRYEPTPGGYPYADALVEGLKKVADFEISVAGYPEQHPESPTLASDLEHLKRKVDKGASRIITQFFMEPADFLRFRDRALDGGISVPVVPGILPITNFKKTVDFARRCGARVPEWMVKMFEGADDYPETRQLVAATVAAEQCRVLCAEGVRDFHFYTLNRAELSFAICHMLGLRARKN